MLFIGAMGSIGIFYLVVQALGPRLIIHPTTYGINYFGVASALGVMFAVGLVDDFKNLKPLVKLVGQVIAATIAAASGVLLDRLADPFSAGFIEFGPWAYPITIFYLVAFANIINLIDGLDGLAAGICAISATALFVLAIGKGGYDAAVFSLATIGACLAFLCFNFHPAKVFMGDSGALFLGFMLGLISLFGVVRTPALVTLLVPVIIAGIPVIDTFFAIIRRLRVRQSIGEADRGHIHHRFMNIGYGQRRTVLVMYALSAILAVCAVQISSQTGAIRAVLVVIMIVIVTGLVWRLQLTGSVLQHYYHKRELHSQEDEDYYDEDVT